MLASRTDTTSTFTTRMENYVEDAIAEMVDRLRYDENGLIPVVVQRAIPPCEVLMVAWANREAIQRTLDTGFGYFYSRSRQQLWKKGESSGNTLEVQEILVDCDSDTLLYRVQASGPACHLNTPTCFTPLVNPE